MQWLGILLTAALLAVIPGYGMAQPTQEKAASPAAAPQVKAEAGSATQPAKSYSASARRAYQKKAAAELDRLQKQFDDFGNKPLPAPNLKHEKLRIVVSLQQQMVAARHQLAALEQASANDWGGLKAKLEKTLQDLSNNLNGAETAMP